MLQKSVQKVLWSIRTIFNTWPNRQFGHVYKKVRRNQSMIDRFTGVANLKSYKKGGEKHSEWFAASDSTQSSQKLGPFGKVWRKTE
jgi:hypothetical protein